MFSANYDTTEFNYRSAEQFNSAMSKVYANMGLAVITSMLVSMIVSSSPALMIFLFTATET